MCNSALYLLKIYSYKSLTQLCLTPPHFTYATVTQCQISSGDNDQSHKSLHFNILQ